MTGVESDEHALAAAVATRAGEMLVALRSSLGSADPAQVRAAGDRQAHELIVGLLAAARPGDAILSEEAPDDERRLSSSRVWIVDPLDGTREYGEPGRSDWAVHVALWSEGDLAAGAVSLPQLGVTLATGGAGPPEPTPPTSRLMVSRTRPPTFVSEIARALGMELVPMGSAGAKIMAVVSGQADGYVHAGGQYQWDSAAPVAVARWHGLHTSRLDGTPLRYNRPDLRLPDLVVCRPELSERILAAIARATTRAVPG